MATAGAMSARWEMRLRISRPRPFTGWVLLLSLALHVAVLVLLLVAPRPKPPQQPMLAAPVAMVFMPPKHSARAAPHPSKQSRAASPAVAPTPPTPAPPTPAPHPAPPTPAPHPEPHPAPPARQAQTPPARPSPPQQVRTPPSSPPAPSQPASAPAAVPLPPPPPPAPSPHTQTALVSPPRLTRPQPTPHPSRHSPAAQPAFPAPMAFSLGRPLVSSRAPRPPATSSHGPAASGPLSYGRFARVTNGHVDPSWLDALQGWWNQHGYYPPEAVANGEDGTVGIQIVVDRSGHVRSVERERRSGSQWLDMAAMAAFRDANLPPLPPDTADRQITVDLNINYVLVRR